MLKPFGIDDANELAFPGNAALELFVNSSHESGVQARAVAEQWLPGVEPAELGSYVDIRVAPCAPALLGCVMQRHVARQWTEGLLRRGALRADDAAAAVVQAHVRGKAARKSLSFINPDVEMEDFNYDIVRASPAHGRLRPPLTRALGGAERPGKPQLGRRPRQPFGDAIQ